MLLAIRSRAASSRAFRRSMGVRGSVRPLPTARRTPISVFFAHASLTFCSHRLTNPPPTIVPSHWTIDAAMTVSRRVT